MVEELQAVDAQIQRIIQSKAFRTSELQRNLLVYLAARSAAGTADQLKEYTVGIEVFGKPDSYDPRQESVVRMHAARLRQKLTDYYRTEGVDDATIVDLPKGAFKLTVEQRPAATPVAVPEPKPNRWPLIVLIFVTLVSGVSAYFWNIRKAPGPPVRSSELDQLWTPLLTSNRPLLVCLATPSEGITGAGTATGAFLLGQFLASRKQNVLLTRSDLLSVPELMINNVVFLGSTVGIRQVQGAFTGQQLVLEKDGIRNLHPRLGEQSFITDGPDQSYALITHVPGLHGNGDSLYLSGNQIAGIMAGVQAFTDPVIARTLVAKLKGLRFYQVVLKVSTMDSMPIDISYVLHRDLSLPGQ